MRNHQHLEDNPCKAAGDIIYSMGRVVSCLTVSALIGGKMYEFLINDPSLVKYGASVLAGVCSAAVINYGLEKLVNGLQEE